MLQRYLGTLESYVGREVQTSDILPNERLKAFWPNNKYSVKFEEKDKIGDYRSCDFNLMGQGPNAGPTPIDLMTLASIKYEGRIKA